MQNSFAVGYGLAAVVAFVLLPIVGWRGVFGVGILPALLTFWIRRKVPKSPEWTNAQAQLSQGRRTGLRALLTPELARRTIVLTLLNACCMFVWWGFNLWVPSYLGLPGRRGGIGFSPRTMTVVLVVMQCGMWLGYVSFGYLATAFGRKRVYVSFLLGAALLLAGSVHCVRRGYYCLWGRALLLWPPATSAASAQSPQTLILKKRDRWDRLSPTTWEDWPAQRPFVVGALAERHGFAAAFHLNAAAFIAAAAFWLLLR